MEVPSELAPVTSPRQLEQVRSLLLEYAATRPNDPALTAFSEEIANLPGEYGPPRGALLLALSQSSPAGCVALRPLDEPACEMKRLYVSPEFRGTGLGRRLARAIMDEALALGYRLMRLDSIPSMQTAQALYESMGFRQIPPYKNNPNPGTRYYEIDLQESQARA